VGHKIKEDIAKIGAFHLASDRTDPPSDLESALRKRTRDELSCSLVVLPEAFNTRGPYGLEWTPFLRQPVNP
jgi:hypothetical protein